MFLPWGQGGRLIHAFAGTDRRPGRSPGEPASSPGGEAPGMLWSTTMSEAEDHHHPQLG